MISNAVSLSAQKNLARTQLSLAGNLGRLSSGQRINTAADDAAGLGISERLKAQIRSLSQAERNAQDGLSMTQIADGAMNEQSGILTRLRELAVESANGSLGSSERTYIQTEADQLVQELDNISSQTAFNNINMISAGAPSMEFQVGIQNGDIVTVGFISSDAASLGVDALDYSSAASSSTALDTLDAAIDTLSTARATIGASQNRLQVSLQNLATAHENLSAANSRIRDVDVAEETSAMTRNQILSQAGVAVLAQANQLPQAALSLLGAGR
ncbi:MAG: flagellin [Myxococcota bacterium]